MGPSTPVFYYESVLTGKTGEAFYFAPRIENRSRQLLRFSFDGELPDGIGLDPGAGILSGTPKVGGYFEFYVTLNWGSGSETTGALLLEVR